MPAIDEHEVVELLEFGMAMSQSLAVDHALTERLIEGFSQSASTDDLFDRLWPLVKERTCLDRFRARMIVELLVDSLTLEGDCIECGAFRGGISLLMGLVLRELGESRRVFICDSFEGLPAPDRRFDRSYSTGEFKGDLEELEHAIDDLELRDHCVIHAGWFEDTFGRFPAGQTFSFAHVDCDLYQPAVECLDFLHPRLARGGVIVCDDYWDGSHGIMRAVNQHVHGTGEVLFLGPAPHCFLVKGTRRDGLGEDRTTLRIATLDGEVEFVLDPVAKHAEYRFFLRKLDALYEARLRKFRGFTGLLGFPEG